MHALVWILGFACGAFVALKVGHIHRRRRALRKAAANVRRQAAWRRRVEAARAERAVEQSGRRAGKGVA